jgi:hydrogenase nickel incorporation protein HypA/HybF
MHELSIVLGIIEIAENQAAQARVSVVEEIELEIGTMSGIEMSALEQAWNQSVKKTILENAKRTIVRPEARARCLDCNCDFGIMQYYDACPDCGGHLLSIYQGKELRVKSLVVSDM